MQKIIISKILQENIQDLSLNIYISSSNSMYFKKFEILNNKVIRKLTNISDITSLDINKNIEILNLHQSTFSSKNLEVIKNGINSICSNENVKYIIKVGDESLEFYGNSILRKLHGIHHKTFYKILDESKLSNTQKYIFIIRWMKFIN